MDGRGFILKTLIYFETQDEPVFYRWCATLKKVLDAYDIRFQITAEQKFKSEEHVLAFRSKERERQQSVEDVRIIHRNRQQKLRDE